MASSPVPRVFARRLLGRDRLEIVEQSARQTQALLMVQVDRIAAIETDLRSASTHVANVSDALDRIHRTLVDADPEATRAIVDTLRVEVGDLVVTINRLLAEQATATD